MENGEPFGCLTTKLSQDLSRLQTSVRACAECQGIEYEGITSSDAITEVKASLKKQKQHQKMLIEINVYCCSHCSKEAGNAFDASRLFLQLPKTDLRSLPYDNPQLLKFPGLSEADYLQDVDSDTEECRQELVQQTSRSRIDEVLDHPPQHNFLREVAADACVSTELAK